MADEAAARTNGNADSKPAGTRQCNLRMLFLKDLSFESPHVPGVLFGHEQPELKFSIESRHKLREKTLFEVLLNMTVHAKAGEKSLFLIELEQGGLFEIEGYSTEETMYLLKTKCPETLYPYARELISSMASRGGFPRLQLRALDFEALYAESRQGKTPSQARAAE